jgi:hypothetical protein
MALQWEGEIATTAESRAAASTTGRMYCDVSRSNNTISVTNIYMSHSLVYGYDNDPWQTDMWAAGTLVHNSAQTKGNTSGYISNNWYSSGTASHSFGVGTSAGTFYLQGNWRQNIWGYVAATRSQPSVSYPAAGSPTLDSQSNTDTGLTSRRFDWTSSPGTYCTFSSLKIQYGLDTGYGSESTGLSEDSNTTITGLTPGTSYHYRYVITNGAGLTTNSSDYEFTLTPAPNTSHTLLQILGIV